MMAAVRALILAEKAAIATKEEIQIRTALISSA